MNDDRGEVYPVELEMQRQCVLEIKRDNALLEHEISAVCLVLFLRYMLDEYVYTSFFLLHRSAIR